MNKGQCIYTLLNRHIISEKTIVYRLTNSKKNHYYLDKMAQFTYV